MSVKCNYLNLRRCMNAKIGITYCPFQSAEHAKICCKGYEPEEEPLKACPFDGGKAKLLVSTDTEYPHWKVSCTEIGCVGSATNLWHGSKEDAIKAWNTRVQQ